MSTTSIIFNTRDGQVFLARLGTIADALKGIASELKAHNEREDAREARSHEEEE